MNCRTILKMFAAYQDGELDSSERSRVESHLESCLSCSKYYAETEGVWQALDGMQEIEPSPGFYRSIFKKIHAPPRKNHFQKYLSWIMDFFPAPAVAIPVLLICIVCGVAMGNIIGSGLGIEKNYTTHSQSLTNVNTVGVFSPIPPGTLGDGYLRLAGISEEHKK
ncbi:MAG: anti-sigma factor [Deltaproteobacteria bacterium]|nr:anti-sigma factor [Deltaproteobacteria bacterium]